MTASQTTSFRHAFVAMFFMTVATLCAQTNTSTVNFGSNDTVEISGGAIAATDPSGLSSQDQAVVLAKVNAKLAAAGINHTVVNENGPGYGATGDIIVSDSQAPPEPGIQGNETDVGDGTGGPSLVFMAEHPNSPHYQHLDDIANSIKALIAARLGAGANNNSSPNATTQVQGSARFTDLPYGGVSAIQMQFNSGITNAMTERHPQPTDVRYRLDTTPGRRLNSLDVQLTYLPGQLSGSRFGHLRADGTFVAFGQQGLLESAPASFFHDGSGVDFAIRLSSGSVYSLSLGTGRADLLQANPNNPEVFDRMNVVFNVHGNPWPDATIQVQTQVPGAGGFFGRFYPGTDEDLVLTGSINVHAAFLSGQPAQVAHPSDVLNTRIRSPLGQFAEAPTFLIGQPFTMSSPINPVALPGIHLGAAGHFVMQVGGIGPAGMFGVIPVPVGWSGYSLLLQGVALSPQSGNGLFGATDGMTLTIL